MAWISTTLLLISLPLLLQLVCLLLRHAKYQNKLPPVPRGFPVFGSLHLLGKFPHQDLHKLGKKYGPIMFMRLGLIPAVVVSSPEYAEQILKTHDLVFSSRPPNEAARHIGYNQKNLSFAPYGSYWRNLRKMCTLDLKVNSFKSIRREELHLVIDSIKEVASSGDPIPVNLSEKVSSLSADVSCRMVFGKNFMEKELDERGFKAVVQEGMVLAASLNLSEYIPSIAQLDLQGLGKKMKAVGEVFDTFFEKIIDEHIQSQDQNRTKDFVDVLLTFLGSQETEYSIGREKIKALIVDMLAASMDTSATTVEWVLFELIKHTRVMKKFQQELQEKIGIDRMVEESDLDSLDYLNMVIKEAFRLHPVAPLLLLELALPPDTFLKPLDDQTAKKRLRSDLIRPGKRRTRKRNKKMVNVNDKIAKSRLTYPLAGIART